MAESFNLTPFLGSTMTLVFMFSTMYTLAFFYYTDANQVFNAEGLSDEPNDPSTKASSSSGFFGTVISFTDGVLELISWLSPMALIKSLFVAIEFKTKAPFIYTLLNLFILRPVGWLMAIFTLNFVISKIPTVSGET